MAKLVFLLAITVSQTVMAQNIGINNPTPQYPLSFNGSLGDKISLWSDGSLTHYGFGIQSESLQMFTKNPTDRIVFGSGSSTAFIEKMRIDENGNVGIGTTSPGARLHVYDGNASLALFGPSVYGGSLYVGASPNQNIALTAQVIASDGNLHIDPAPGKNVYIGYYQPRDIYLNSNGGNVGIGNLNAFAPLTLNNIVGEKISLYGSEASNYGFGIQDFTLQIHSAAVGDDIAFGYGSSASFTETMRIKGNGNVGIGNSSPEYQLDVSNRIRIRSGGNNSVSAGLWLNNNANSEAAFIGMEDDTHVGLFGNNGAGFKFGMNTSTGDIKMMGKVGIGTAATPAATLEVNGYTKLGSNAPSIKVKKLTGTTAPNEGDFLDIAHGLVQSKILSISVMVFDEGGRWFPDNYSSIGYIFQWHCNPNTIRVINTTGASANILSRPIMILITYEE